jgi:hypothetical protein
MQRFSPFLLLVACPYILWADSPPNLDWDRDVRPFFGQYCSRCHNEKNSNGGVNVDVLKSLVSLQRHRDGVMKMANALDARVMPLAGQIQPSDALRRDVAGWLRYQLDHFDYAKYRNPGNVQLHRLTRTQYHNTVRDLIGVGEEISDELPADESTFGFDHIAEVQEISPAHMEQYLSAATYILDRAFLPAATTWEWEAAKLSYVRQFGLAGGDEKVQFPDGAPDSEILGHDRVILRAGGVSFGHKFPHTGLYSVKLHIWGEKAEGARGKPSLRIKLDGIKVAEIQYEAAGPGKATDSTARFIVRSGLHDLKFEMEGMAYTADARDPLKRFNRLGLGHIEMTGPVPEDEARAARIRANLLGATPGPALRPREAARKVLENFLPKAFRRPARPDEVERYLSFFDRYASHPQDYERAVQLTLRAVLISPSFLLHIERERDTLQPYRIDDFELANRLSYFLWASMPDEELFAAANQGRLHEPAILEAQTERMLKDPRSKSLGEKFAPQWLGLGSLFAVHRDGDFNENNLSNRQMMLDEVVLFFDSVVRENRSILDLLDADYTFVNERLARHYGIAGVTGREMRRVALDGPVRQQRGGVMTMAAVLLSTSHPKETNPPGRGKWVLDALLGTPPAPPPADVKPLAVAGKNAQETLTVRERLTQHRSEPACAGCHAKIDPLGFALENYSETGAWRGSDEGKPVDASGQLAKFAPFNGPVELKKLLSNDMRGLFIRNFTSRMFTYAVARGPEFYDEGSISDAEAALRANDFRIGALVKSIVQSYAFQYRQNQTQKENSE